MTLTQMVDEIKQRIPTALTEDTAIPTGNIPRWINEGIREMSRRHPWTFLRRYYETTLPVAGSLLDFPGEPIDPTGRLTVTTTDGEKRIWLVDDATAQSRYLSTDTGEPEVYVLRIKSAATDPGAKTYQMQIFPAADSTNGPYTLTVEGWFYPSPLDDANKDNRFTIEMPYEVMEFAIMRAREHKNQYDKASMNETRFDRMMQRQIDLDNMKQVELVQFLRPTLGGRDRALSGPIDEWGRGVDWGW